MDGVASQSYSRNFLRLGVSLNQEALISRLCDLEMSAPLKYTSVLREFFEPYNIFLNF